MTHPDAPAARAGLAVSGPDAAAFLNGLLTCALPTDGAATPGALLTPQGKILFDFVLARTGNAFHFDVHEDAVDAFARRLGLYKLRAKVEIEPLGPLAEGDLQREYAIGTTGYHAARIAAGAPEWGADFGSDEVFPMDVNLDARGGVDYKKGCFIGQEVASRMKRKGEVRKRTLIAEVEGAAPARGAPVLAGESTLGHVMSGAPGMALALVRLDRVCAAEEAGAAILCEERPLRLRTPACLAGA